MSTKTTKHRTIKYKDLDCIGELLAPWLAKMGATPNEHGWYPITTKLGVLLVRPIDDWVACQFRDGALDAAKKHFGITGIQQGRLNPYSGKWNWHPWDVVTKPYGTYTRNDLELLVMTMTDAIEELLEKVPA